MLSRTFAIVGAFTRPMRENDSGATAVEYGLILALISAVVLGVLLTLGPQLAGVFSNITTGFTPPAP